MIFEHIGTIKEQICYDDKMHKVTLTDYLVKLTGDTYNNRKLIWKQNRLNTTEQQFHWDNEQKAWFANIESEQELNRLHNVFKNTGVVFAIRPVYRITD